MTFEQEVAIIKRIFVAIAAVMLMLIFFLASGCTTGLQKTEGAATSDGEVQWFHCLGYCDGLWIEHDVEVYKTTTEVKFKK